MGVLTDSGYSCNKYLSQVHTWKVLHGWGGRKKEESGERGKGGGEGWKKAEKRGRRPVGLALVAPMRCSPFCVIIHKYMHSNMHKTFIHTYNILIYNTLVNILLE